MSLSSIYAWAAGHGYPAEKEHVKIEEIPVQFLSAHNELADDAITSAVMKPYQSVAVKMVRPEDLIALYLERSAKP